MCEKMKALDIANNDAIYEEKPPISVMKKMFYMEY